MSEPTGLLQGIAQTLRRNKWLLVILCVAFLLRLGFMLKFTPVISGDGCEYIRMGMELRDGKPLTGVFEWPETMYGTFYPVLIAGVSHLGLSAEHAAKLLALLFGTGLVLLAFLPVTVNLPDMVSVVFASAVPVNPGCFPPTLTENSPG